ncbi:hypothetical protein ACFQI7_06825 [Paenibacillus allorhizosphaerae]|uniref:DUF2680 domain-containing protein n=1 Tax=Paenibacillus allorhizosphaerae TaxID=2849866 RepID=A0ABM8VFQ0_9BACL|nr:hypothetical protein [Paenibacillus allorhizosphaerae]CAG7635818.1 hypothetical protein PAECIP111802_02183 [Paenibacillus allorhizosphaerae]
MSYGKWLGVGALIAVLLSGCGTNSQGQPGTASANAASPAAANTQGQTQSNATEGKAPMQMNEQERQMMMTFQTLVRMDKANGLAITKEQAQAMLPVVQDSITKKELSSDAKTKLLEKLTADQKKFVDDAAANMQNRPDRSQMTEEQKKKMSEAGQGAQAGNKDGQADQGNQADRVARQANKGNAADQGNKGEQKGQGGNSDRPGRNGGGANIGKQLVELLQSKMK